MRGDTGRFRCDECRKVFDMIEDGGDDTGESNWFCWRCQHAIESREAIIAGRIESKHGVVISSHHAHLLAHYGRD
jgi:hypothetical protein